MALYYRAWQLGHRMTVREPDASLPNAAPTYLRCSCGWEARSPEGRFTVSAYRHLDEVTKSADHSLVPVIDEWPPGITAKSTLDDLYRVLLDGDEG
jgi:hypothetical protein